MPMYLQKVALSVSNRQNSVSHSLPHNIYRINSSSWFHCFHPLSYDIFHHGRAETTTRLSLFWDAQPLALHFTISIWWRLGNRSVQFRNQGGSSSVVAGWWFQKTCLLESARKLGVPKPPEIYGYIFLEDCRHWIFVCSYQIHRDPMNSPRQLILWGDYDEVWWALKYFDKAVIQYTNIAMLCSTILML